MLALQETFGIYFIRFILFSIGGPSFNMPCVSICAADNAPASILRFILLPLTGTITTINEAEVFVIIIRGIAAIFWNAESKKCELAEWVGNFFTGHQFRFFLLQLKGGKANIHG